MGRNKLISIVCLWDGVEFLPFLSKAMSGLVDETVVIFSHWSNHKNYIKQKLPSLPGFKYFNWEPRPGDVHRNETNKRNFGLKIAKQRGASHVLMQDVDEFYLPDEFNREKERIYSNNLNGTVCKLVCYFKEPTLWVNDHTLVPFIQKVVPGLSFGSFKAYPFACDKEGNAHIDPTRRTNQTRKIEWSDITMHHYSWIRKDIESKIQNSSARQNLLKSTIYKDLENAKPGYYCEFYRDTIKEAPNYFNIYKYD